MSIEINMILLIKLCTAVIIQRSRNQMIQKFISILMLIFISSCTDSVSVGTCYENPTIPQAQMKVHSVGEQTIHFIMRTEVEENQFNIPPMIMPPMPFNKAVTLDNIKAGVFVEKKCKF
jgi:hypothetical protein